MFLYLLNETQKKLFLKLANKAAEANSVVTQEERDMLGEFAQEMRIEPIYSVEESTEEILTGLAEQSSEKARKIIALEIIGIMYSDSKYDEMEKDFVMAMADKFGIPETKIEEMENAITEYESLYKKIAYMVFQ